ncbi:MAG: trypsin-like peptidase domain-containing protein [Holosporales bacterium]|jgi:S1-C subfamily serine protease|nr:trypsin-like peptidase domain-containing protein [Holosporales bacterium]
MIKVFTVAWLLAFIGRAEIVSAGEFFRSLIEGNDASSSEQEEDNGRNVATQENLFTPYAKSSNSKPSGTKVAVNKALPAVVSISTVSEVNSPFMNDPLFSFFFNGGLQPKALRGGGSGVIVDPRGYVVTCAHVVDRAKVVTVTVTNIGTFKAKVIFSDPSLDLAVLQLTTGRFKGELPFCKISEDLVEIGDKVVAIGNAFGLGLTVTRGIVSATLRIIDGRVVCQTDASVNPGNSGGPVLNRDGDLAGIASAIYSRHGGFIGIGFFVPGMAVRYVVNRAIHKAKESVAPFQVASLDPSVVAALHDKGLPIQGGCEVVRIVDSSTGIKPRDVILSVAGLSMPCKEVLSFYTKMIPVGTQYQVHYIKADDLSGDRLPEIRTILVEAKEKKASSAAKGVTLQGKHILHNVVVADLTDDIATRMNIDSTEGGAVVVKAPEGSIVCESDIILGCNQEKVTCVDDLKLALEKGINGYMLQMRRGSTVLMMQGSTGVPQQSDMF